MVLLPKRPSCQRGFIDVVSVLTLVVLLVGLVAGTYLVGQRQELRKLAALPEEEAPPPEEVVQPPPPPEQPPQQPPEQPPQQPPPAEQPPSEGRACTYSDVGCEAGFHADGTYPKCSCEPDATPYCIEGLCPYGCDPSPSGGTCKTAPPPPPPQPPAPLCGDGTCNTEVGESCSTCPADCGVCPAPQPAQTPTVPLPGDYQSWRCPGPNCDKCGFQGWWASGCDPFITAHPGDAPYASERYSGGQLTACGSVSKQCSSVGETKCGADTGYKETSCGNDGCFHETGGTCQPTQLAQPIQPPLVPPPQPLVTGPCNLDEIQISCPNGEKVCQNLITGSPQCAAAAPAPSTCANCLAVARDPYECASECNLAVVSKVGYDPTAFASLIDENQRLKQLGLVKETVLPSDFKPYDPGDSELVKKYGNGSLEQTKCLIEGLGLVGARGGCEPEVLYLRDKYGEEGANKIIITKEAYKKTADLGCGNVFNEWGEKCKDAFQAYTAAGFKAKDNEGTNTIAGLGTAFVAGLAGGPGGIALFATSDFLFSKTRLDEQETSKALLEDRYGKGVIDVGSTSFLGSASTLAQRAGIDTSSLGSASRVDILYRAYNSLVTNPFIIKPVPAAFDPRDVTNPNEQVRIIQEINKILTPSGSARGRVLPGPAKEQVKNWGEVVALQNMRSGFLAYKDTALSSGYGQVYLQKNDEFKRELTTNLALDAATAGVGHVVGQAFKGAVKGAEGTAVKKVVDDLAEKRLLTATEGLASEAERLNAIKGLINDAEARGGEVVFKNEERLAVDDVLLKTKFEQGLVSSSDIKAIVFSGDKEAASELVKGAKETAGFSLDHLRSDALAKRAINNVDTNALLTGLEKGGGDVTEIVEASKIKPPEAPSGQSFLEKARELISGERGALELRRSDGADYLARQGPGLGVSSDRLLSVYDDVSAALERQRPVIEGGLSPNYDELLAPATQRIRVVYPKNSEEVLAEIKKAAQIDADTIRIQAIRREQKKIIAQSISSLDETQLGVNKLLKDQKLFMDRIPLNPNTESLFSDIRQIIADIERYNKRLAEAKAGLKLVEGGTSKEPIKAITQYQKITRGTIADLDNAILKLKAKHGQLMPLVAEGGPRQAGLIASETQSRALENLEKAFVRIEDTPVLFLQGENQVSRLNRAVAAIKGPPSSVLLGSGPAQLFEDFSNATIYRVLPEARTEGVIPAVINRIRGGPKPPGGAELPAKPGVKTIAAHDSNVAGGLAVSRKEIKEGAEIKIVVLGKEGDLTSRTINEVATREDIVEAITQEYWNARGSGGLPQRITLEITNPGQKAYKLEFDYQRWNWSSLTDQPSPLFAQIRGLGIQPDKLGFVLSNFTAGLGMGTGVVVIVPRIACPLLDPENKTDICWTSQKIPALIIQGLGLVPPPEPYSKDWWLLQPESPERSLALQEISDNEQDENFRKDLLKEKCAPPGSLNGLPSSRGYVVCTDKGEWKGECIPGQVWYDARSGLPAVCGNDYRFKYLTQSWRYLTKDALNYYRGIDQQRILLENKYEVRILPGFGYINRPFLESIDKLFPELPASLYRGKTIETFMGFKGPNVEVGGKIFWGAPHYTRLSIGPAGVGEGDIEFMLDATVHELIHLQDLAVVSQQLNSREDYQKILQTYNIRYEGNKLLATVGGEKATLGGEYNCSFPSNVEFFACAGALYVFQPEKLKGDFPLLYDYYKSTIFSGKEYLGRNLAKEIKSITYPTPIPLPTPEGTISPFILSPTPPPGVFATPPPTPQYGTVLAAFPDGNYNFFLTADDLRESIQKDIKEGKVRTGDVVWVCDWLKTEVDLLGIKLASRTCTLISIPNP